jgi:hypothetical protein
MGPKGMRMGSATVIYTDVSGRCHTLPLFLTFFIKVFCLFQKSGVHYIAIPVESVQNVMGSLKNVEVRIEAALTEYLYRETVRGFSHTRIISSSINLYFLGSSPMVFKPAMLFEGYVSLMHKLI